MSDQPSPETLPPTDAMARLAASRAAFAALRPRVEAAGPWPLAEDIGSGPEASWGPREVLAHTAEMLSYWLGELERIVEAGRGAGDALPFGRQPEDALRVGILGRDRTLPVRELFERIDVGIGRWLARVPTLTAQDRAAVGLHPRLGEMTADGVRDRFVVTHLEEHVAQLEEILAGR